MENRQDPANERDQLADELKALAFSIEKINKKEITFRAGFAGLEHESPAEFFEDLEMWFVRN